MPATSSPRPCQSRRVSTEPAYASPACSSDICSSSRWMTGSLASASANFPAIASQGTCRVSSTISPYGIRSRSASAYAVARADHISSTIPSSPSTTVRSVADTTKARSSPSRRASSMLRVA